MSICVETKELTKKYGSETAVSNLNMTVPEGAIYGFLGPNGAGKTTTLKMLLGLIHPSGGEIRLFGTPLSEQSRLKLLRHVGSLIEAPSYYGHLTARENLEIVRSLRSLPKSEIERALKTVRLDHTGSKTASKFSLGMKQRLGIAAALMGSPKLLLLDEPTNGLDPAGIQEMRRLIRTLPAQYGMSVVVSSHLLTEIDQIADHVGIIRHGELVFQDSLHALHALSKTTLAIRTDDNAKAQSLLGAEIQEDYLILSGMNDAEAAKLGARLYHNGVNLVRMEERQEKLEDIFLAMTGTEADS